MGQCSGFGSGFRVNVHGPGCRVDVYGSGCRVIVYGSGFRVNMSWSGFMGRGAWVRVDVYPGMTGVTSGASMTITRSTYEMIVRVSSVAGLGFEV